MAGERAPLELSPAPGFPVVGGLTVLVGATPPCAARLGDEAVDLIVVDAPFEARAARAAALGARGVGGVCGGGRDATGRLVVVRRRGERRASELAPGERWSGERVLAVGGALAEALAALEEASLGAGSVRPSDIALGDAPFIACDVLVRALLGMPADAGAGTGPSPRWTPPQQAEGAPWDAAANRYVLGLLLYRLLAGEHPFGGAGLRHAQATHEAPPFEEAVATSLRPGVQAFILSLVSRDVAARPASARALADACRKWSGEGVAASSRTAPTPSAAARRAHPGPPEAKAPASSTAEARPPPIPSPASASAPRAAATSAAPSRWSRLAGQAIVVLGVAATLVAWLGRGSPSVATTGAPLVREPLRSMSAEACAPCHAKEFGEWKRSVMGFAAKSPLYLSLESAVEEQVGKDARCPGGAGILRKRGANACVDPATGGAVTGSGGEHWCVHCHAPLDQLASRVPTWPGADFGGSRGRQPLSQLLSPEASEGITCVACHTSVGPVDAHARAGRRTGNGYEGNPTWTSPRTGQEFLARPEDQRGLFGIANSGYRLAPDSFFLSSIRRAGPLVHDAPTASARAYLRSSEFCGACHDVRLFGTDVVGVRDRGEHFKRLRNAYSEWASWAKTEERAGRSAASCQDCHMSTFPGICQVGASTRDPRSASCPPGSGFVARAPGAFGKAASHYFTGVEIPMARSFPADDADDASLDADGVPVGLRARRDLLLRSAFELRLGDARVRGDVLELPVQLTNVGAGHRVPAGFSQEREFWLELRVTDARGRVVYEVGRVDRADEDLHDKTFLRVRTREEAVDGAGRPLGMFGADVADGPDAPRWSPNPVFGGTSFRGKGLINFQNGFLRCVRCVGTVRGDGSCAPGPGQGTTRAGALEDGDYDPDTGVCRSNMFGGHELFETYFPIGSLDADRGVLRAPDAIIDTRSAAPGVPIRYTYEIDGIASRARPLRVEARLRFRAFPPFLLRAFAAYERDRVSRGERPGGPLLDESMVRRLEIVDLATTRVEVP